MNEELKQLNWIVKAYSFEYHIEAHDRAWANDVAIQTVSDHLNIPKNKVILTSIERS